VTLGAVLAIARESKPNSWQANLQLPVDLLPSPFSGAIWKRFAQTEFISVDPAQTFDIGPETGLRPLTVKQ
jgi:hypothetical protein